MAVNIMSLSTTINRKKLYQGQPGTGEGTLYTVPASTDVKLQSIIVCNTTASPATISLSVATGAAGTANRILNGFTVLANDTVSVDVGTGIDMTAADIISGLQGTGSAITVTISGETYV